MNVVTLREARTRTWVDVEEDGVRWSLVFQRRTKAESAVTAIEMRFLDVAGLTLEEFYRRWLAVYAERNMNPKSVAYYRRFMENRVLQHLGARRLDTITKNDVLELQEALARSGCRRRHIAIVTAVLSAVLGKARMWRYIQRNPARDLDELTLGERPAEIVFEGFVNNEAA